MRMFLAFVGLLAVLCPIAAAIFFFGGYYSVAGTAGEPGIVKWAIAQARDASIARHATNKASPTLNEARALS